MSAVTKEIFSGEGQRQLLEQLPQTTYLLDPDTGACVFVNDRFYELLGFENRGQGHPPGLFNERVLPIDKDRIPFTSSEKKILDQGGFVSVEYRFYHRDGHVLSLAGRNVNFTFPETGETYILGNLTDVTELRKSELAYKVNSEAYEYAVQQSDMAISVLDEKGYFVHVNPKFSNLYGYRYKEIIGQHLTILAPNEDRKSLWSEIFEEIKNSEGVYDGEWVMASKSGEMLTVTSRNYHIIGSDGSKQVVQFLRSI
ncbi:MAG: PAS domain-containing protein [Cyclobacteriaceae bacterium]